MKKGKIAARVAAMWLVVVFFQPLVAEEVDPCTVQKPNIIFIMSDDHASHAIGAYGSPFIKTPNLDRLAKEGVRFTNCFNVNALCAPSRAAMITGRYNHHNGLFKNGDTFDGSQMTFPKLLQKAGYTTGLIGKWHLSSQPTGFDDYSILPGQGKYFDCEFMEGGEKTNNTEVVKGYVTDVITDKAIGWLEKYDSSKPFCLMVHHKAPHGPYRYPEKYEKLFPDKALPMPGNFHSDYADRGEALGGSRGRWSKLDHVLSGHFNKKVPKHLKKGTRKYKEWAYQNIFNGYLRLVASMDDNIGRLLDYLDQSGLAGNTLVIYTSDNGFFLGDFGLFNKMWMYEESLRLPLIARFPDTIKPGTVNDRLVSILDFAPTLLDFAGSPENGEFQGRSIKPLLKGKTPENWRTAHYYHYYGQYDVPAHDGIRTRDYKLIHFYNAHDDGSWELYDMKKDPKESDNLYGQPNQREVVAMLKVLLKQLRKKHEGR